MRTGPEIERIDFAGEPAWRKRYFGSPRRWRLKLLDRVARILGVTALRPPPRPLGAAALDTELGRIRALAAAGVHVPRVLSFDADQLVLSDLGQTLAVRLRQSDRDQAAHWFNQAASAIVDVHRKGHYLGQPQARNIVIDGDARIGFLDFEEDPGEIMSLVDAQVRDWLLFMAGTARHMPQDEGELAQLLQPWLAQVPEAVGSRLRWAATRLGFLAWLVRFKGSRAAGIGKAIRALGGAG